MALLGCALYFDLPWSVHEAATPRRFSSLADVASTLATMLHYHRQVQPVPSAPPPPPLPSQPKAREPATPHFFEPSSTVVPVIVAAEEASAAGTASVYSRAPVPEGGLVVDAPSPAGKPPKPQGKPAGPTVVIAVAGSPRVAGSAHDAASARAPTDTRTVVWGAGDKVVARGAPGAATSASGHAAEVDDAMSDS